MKSLIMNIGEFRMHLDPLKRGISGALWGQGYREPAFMWILKQEAKGKLGLDVGANLGYVTLSMCKGMDNIIAIEPDERPRKLLKKNIKENNFSQKTKIFKFAVSNKGGTETIYLSKKHPNLNNLCNNKSLKKNKDFLKEKTVKTKTIDSLNIDPNFIKMDIEGYEVEAIQGAYGTLKRSEDCKLLIEVHPQFYNKDRDFSPVLENLFNMGYRVKYIVSAGCEHPDLYKEKGYSPIKVFNDGDHRRGLFKDVKQEDAINFCCQGHKQKYLSRDDYNKVIEKETKKIARSILLVKKNKI